ncbi:unnamed protein product, partial [Hapterophycus canaliculatus]
PVVRVPTRIASNCVIHTMACHRHKSEKYGAIVGEAIKASRQGRAVLIGTHSVAESQEIERRLQETKVSCELLNGVQDADEATVIAAAGQRGRITVATNLAGRGTDISLSSDVRDAGGLHVIVGQIHALARVDRQLVGRSARCGDPGSSRTFVAADDELLVEYAPWISRAIERRCHDQNSEATPAIVKAIDQIQAECERASARQRISNLSIEMESESKLSSIPNSERPTACWAL